MNLFNSKYRISIGVVIGVLTIIGMIWGGVQAVEYELDSRYAKRSEVMQLETSVTRGFKEVLKQIENMTCRAIREELNDLSVKEENGELTEYDIARKNNLELEWQRNCVGNGSS